MLLEALADSWRGVEDLTALTGPHTPAWVGELAVPSQWQPLAPSGEQALMFPARVLGRGPRPGRGWEATDTVEVYSFTDIVCFGDIFNSTARSLHDLSAGDVHTRMLAMPAITAVATERSTALLAIAGQPMWTQLTHYVAGSKTPHAGRLIVHTVSVAEPYRAELDEDIALLTSALQDAFTALLASGRDLTGRKTPPT